MKPLSAALWTIDACGAGVCLLATLGAWGLLIRPAVIDASGAEARAADAAAAVQRAVDIEADLARAQAALAQVQEEIRSSPVVLEPADRVNHRVSQVTALADEAGLELDRIQPGDAIDGARWRIVPVLVTGVGPLTHVAAFMHVLHERLPDVGIDRFSVSTEGESTDGPTSVRFEFGLSWFAAPTPAPAPKN